MTTKVSDVPGRADPGGMRMASCLTCPAGSPAQVPGDPTCPEGHRVHGVKTSRLTTLPPAPSPPRRTISWLRGMAGQRSKGWVRGKTQTLRLQHPRHSLTRDALGLMWLRDPEATVKVRRARKRPPPSCLPPSILSPPPHRFCLARPALQHGLASSPQDRGRLRQGLSLEQGRETLAKEGRSPFRPEASIQSLLRNLPD